jgi:hypothetical protein
MRPRKSDDKERAEFLARVRAMGAKALAAKQTKRAESFKQIEDLTRRGAERERVQRHYCTLFRFWRSCPLKECHRARVCRGDANACLKRSVGGVPPEELSRARKKLLEATPRHIGKAEREVRQTWPADFWRRPVDPAVREALARAEEEREQEKRFGIGLEQD